MVNIKVETWKIKGKNRRIVTSRGDDGRILAWRGWSPKSFNLNSAEKLFKKNKTFNPKIKKSELTKFVEVIDERIVVKNDRIVSIPSIRKGIVLYEIKAELGSEKYYARSKKGTTDTNKNILRDEAYENLWRQIAGDFGFNYDDFDEVREMYVDDINILKERLVYYNEK